MDDECPLHEGLVALLVKKSVIFCCLEKALMLCCWVILSVLGENCNVRIGYVELNSCWKKDPVEYCFVGRTGVVIDRGVDVDSGLIKLRILV